VIGSFLDSLFNICIPDRVIDGLLTVSDAIETEAALFGSPLTLTLSGVVGCHISGTVDSFCTSTDIVLAITKVPLWQHILNTLMIHLRCLF